MGLRMKCSYGFFTSSAEPKNEKPACSSATEAMSVRPTPRQIVTIAASSHCIIHEPAMSIIIYSLV